MSITPCAVSRPFDCSPSAVRFGWACLVLCCLIALWTLPIVSAEEPGEADDEILLAVPFDQSLDEGWSWIRESPGGWRIRDGALEIRSGVGTMDRATNLLVRPAPAVDDAAVAAEVTVRNGPTEQYEQCGIVWYYNDRIYVKLVKEMVDGKSWIVMGCSLPGGGRLAGKVPFPREQIAQLRLTVHAGQIVGSQRQAGSREWHEVGACTLPKNLSEVPRISLQTYHGPPSGDHWARFDDFRVTRRSNR